MVERKEPYLGLLHCNPNDSRKAVCGTCGKCISRGGTTTKNFNTSNLRYH